MRREVGHDVGGHQARQGQEEQLDAFIEGHVVGGHVHEGVGEAAAVGQRVAHLCQG